MEKEPFLALLHVDVDKTLSCAFMNLFTTGLLTEHIDRQFLQYPALVRERNGGDSHVDKFMGALLLVTNQPIKEGLVDPNNLVNTSRRVTEYALGAWERYREQEIESVYAHMREDRPLAALERYGFDQEKRDLCGLSQLEIRQMLSTENGRTVLGGYIIPSVSFPYLPRTVSFQQAAEGRNLERIHRFDPFVGIIGRDSIQMSTENVEGHGEAAALTYSGYLFQNGFSDEITKYPIVSLLKVSYFLDPETAELISYDYELPTYGSFNDRTRVITPAVIAVA